MSKELTKYIDKASEIYTEKTWLRAIVNAVPYIGGSLDVIFDSKGSKIIQRRIIDFLELLKEETSQLKEEIIDKEYLDTEEFFDLIIKVLDASTRTRNRDKILLYVKILCGAVTIQDRREFSVEDYLATLIELTPKEIEVARAIYNQQKYYHLKPKETELQWARRMGWDNLSNECPSVSEEDLTFILLRIQRSGLINEITGSYLGYLGGVYVITEVFKKLVRYLGEE